MNNTTRNTFVSNWDL